MTAAGARAGALVALLLLGLALAAMLVLTTPWRSLPSPVPGGAVPVDVHRDFSAAQLAREDAFHREVRPPAYASLALSLTVAGFLGLAPLGGRIVAALAAPFGGGWVWQVLVGGLGILLLGRVAVLPLDALAEIALRRYGLSTQTWASWLGDVAKGFALTAGLTLLVLLGLYALARAWPHGWWLPAAAAAGALVVALSFLYPLVFEPVFNAFTPMPAGPLRSSLLALADRDGVPVRDVLVADASRRTTALNAYVSGFGSTRRIVVYDTLLKSAGPQEIRLIVAHELGHAKRNDVLHGTLIGALATAAGVCTLFLLLTWPALLRRAGVAELRDPRSLALVLALTAGLMTVSGPLQLLVSRRIEARADLHALDLTREPVAFARMQERLSVANLSDLDPSPLVFGLFASHPTGPQRIALSRDWARLHDVPEPPALAP